MGYMGHVIFPIPMFFYGKTAYQLHARLNPLFVDVQKVVGSHHNNIVRNYRYL